MYITRLQYYYTNLYLIIVIDMSDIFGVFKISVYYLHATDNYLSIETSGLDPLPRGSP